MFLNTIGITEKLSTKPARRGRLSIRVLVAVVRFVIVAVPELNKTGAAAELTCYGSAETARPFSFFIRRPISKLAAGNSCTKGKLLSVYRVRAGFLGALRAHRTRSRSRLSLTPPR